METGWPWKVITLSIADVVATTGETVSVFPFKKISLLARDGLGLIETVWPLITAILVGRTGWPLAVSVWPLSTNVWSSVCAVNAGLGMVTEWPLRTATTLDVGTTWVSRVEGCSEAAGTGSVAVLEASSTRSCVEPLLSVLRPMTWVASPDPCVMLLPGASVMDPTM